ncbi:MAG TPA: ABC transporter permease, partial [Caldisericia bacterium]|nr:ABC transporter permease [Caldisericia bacterium]
SNWDYIIRPQRQWFDLRLGELWRARNLIMLFVWRDFVTYYKQTILGPLWYLIQPLLTSLTFTVVFGNFAKLSTDGLPQFLFYLAGTVVWGYFSACLTKTSNVFTSHANIFGKVYFPRLTVPISILLSNLITLLIQFLLFLAFMIYFSSSGADVHPNATILLLPILLILMAGLGLGFGIIISALTTRYRDLQFLVTFGAQLWMYITPVVYPLSSVPETYRWLVLANPMTSIVETFRFAFLGAGIVETTHLLYSLVCMIVVMLIGILIFNRVERTFMDTV